MDRTKTACGRWFDFDAAVAVADERTYFNGQNHISEATGSQWEHEQLLKTAKGAWVLHRWSQWQGSVPTFEILDDQEAAQWILLNSDDPLPEELAAFATKGEI